jgi:hypothetical protein
MIYDQVSSRSKMKDGLVFTTTPPCSSQGALSSRIMASYLLSAFGFARDEVRYVQRYDVTPLTKLTCQPQRGVPNSDAYRTGWKQGGHDLAEKPKRRDNVESMRRSGTSLRQPESAERHRTTLPDYDRGDRTTFGPGNRRGHSVSPDSANVSERRLDLLARGPEGVADAV